MWLLLAILAVPLIEIGLFVQIGGTIGLWPTIAWVILSAALGIIVLKGVASLGPVTLSRDIHELQDPLSPLAHRVMVAFGGGLLLLPGFLTDAFGILLLIPPVRQVIIRLISRRIRAASGATVQAEVIEGEWQEVKVDRQAPGQDNPPSEWTRH
jgi:UPF0716 protein FxsA